MKFNIPFTILETEILRKRYHKYGKYIHPKKESSIQSYLKNSDSGINASEYLAICFAKFLTSFLVGAILISLILLLFRVQKFFLIGPGISLLFTAFILFNRLGYPKIYDSRKTKEIEKNLISALQDMLVQLNSGVPMFKILTNISSSDYGEVSKELKKAVADINSGKPQLDAIDNLGNKTTSLYFRRVLWQISNGMRAGSDMAIVIKESIDNLAKEQAIQIQSYGNKLNPIIMFYMLLAVIMPALGITFLTIIASMLNIAGKVVNLIFIGLFVMIVLLQITFLGIIRTRRPSLL